jgi:hypothetical protein
MVHVGGVVLYCSAYELECAVKVSCCVLSSSREKILVQKKQKFVILLLHKSKVMIHKTQKLVGNLCPRSLLRLDALHSEFQAFPAGSLFSFPQHRSHFDDTDKSPY